MNHSNIPLAQIVLDLCKEFGLRQVVISPGSRSAPLAISFTSDPFFKTYSIVDERVAGFFAMGMARYLKQPVALVCTSGSALLNYYPAVVEAYYSEIPLVVLSADRPFYKIDRGDGQTIRQSGVFSPHIGYEALLQQDTNHAREEIRKFAPDYLDRSQAEVNQANLEEVSRALQIAVESSLPVHLNTPFEEPLYGITVQEERQLFDAPLRPERQVPEGLTVRKQGLADDWARAEKIMILVGVQSPDDRLVALAEFLGSADELLIFTETTSNMQHPAFFNSIDSIIAPIEKLDEPEEEFRKLRPDLLITLGGLVVSKKIKSFLRNFPPESHWHVGTERANDTFFCLKGRLETDPLDVLKTMRTIASDKDKATARSYVDYWQHRRRHVIRRREEYIRSAPYSDYWVFSRIFDRIPPGYQLHLANSATVRYAQLFDLNDRYRVFCNRGTSGIEGSTSSAIGSAIHDPSPTLLITGDLSFFYDSNALWNSYTPKDFRILLINNKGGGIFRILPHQVEKEQYEAYFETVHNLTASQLCTMYGWNYQCVEQPAEWEDALKDFFSDQQKPVILEVFTPRESNDRILLDYFKYLI